MPPTVTEIGRLAGCSPATVSRAINNSGPVSAPVRAAIVQAMRKTKYLSKRTTRKSSSSSTTEAVQLVEVVLYRHGAIEPLSLERGAVHVGPAIPCPEAGMLSLPGRLTNDFFRQIIDGVLVELAKGGYRAVVQASKDLADPALLATVNALDRRGVLVLGEYSPALPQFVAQCLHPLVLVDLICDEKTDVVTTDNHVGISKAVDHLWELGHRHIGFVGKCDPIVAFAERFAAFKFILAEKGLPLNHDWVWEGPNRIDMTAVGVQRMLRNPQRPTALVCANDCNAIGVLHAASSLGINVPHDLSVVGFDDIEATAIVTPTLTTLHVPMMEIGRRAVRELLIHMQLGNLDHAPGCRIRLMPELVLRQSTAPVKTPAQTF